MSDYRIQTQAFSTWGNKLLQHTSALREIQEDRRFRPITLQLAPTESCDSNCTFCSVSWRDVTKKIPWEALARGLREFRALGAKAVEITGGGNPLLYRDGDKDINDVILLASELGYEIGIITNSERPGRFVRPEVAPRVKWMRVSLIKLDEGKTPKDYDFTSFQQGQLGFSYVIYDGTTVESIEWIAQLVALNPNVKFVRIVADCLTENSLTLKADWQDIIASVDTHSKFFIKEINETFHPFKGGCWVGMLRPYWVWNGVYICTSHVLKHRDYDEKFRLCEHDGITVAWNRMNARFKAGENPYEIDINKECWHCYYHNNNQLLEAVIRELPDKNFA